MHIKAELDRAAAIVRTAISPTARPTVGLILGSGLGSFADRLEGAVKLPFDRIPGIPSSTVVGHAGNLVYGLWKGTEVLALQGRIHYYEGHDLSRVVFPARMLVTLGCRTLIITNAAGGLGDGLSPGEIVVLRDHLNLMGASPLRGPNDDALGPRFPDMSDAYDAGLRALALEVGRAQGLALREGIYAGLSGPSYETPAEIRMLKTLGADLVGMSTVPEVIAARHMGARVLGMSCVTNLAAGISKQKLSHDEVTETADRVRSSFEQLVGGIVAKLADAKNHS